MSQRISNPTDVKKFQTPEAVQAWLVSQLALRLGVELQDIDIRVRFSRYGLDSVGATGLVADLAAALGRPLSPTLVWEYPTIEALARHIAGEASEEPSYPGSRTTRQSETEPIAIIGLACRFPAANNADAFWHLLRDGVDAITEVPAQRWDINAFYDADRATPGKMNTRWGGFLEQVDQFEPQFFGISPREAVEIDPQQRLMLELSWEALEDAGLPALELKGSRTGVFVGAMWSDYGKLTQGEPKYIAQHTATGQDLSIVAARISYTLGLQGPSIALNTACSSALVAVHLACQSLQSGESTLALAGGVNLMLAPDSTVAMSKFGGLSPDGRSKAFDAHANGYVRGEGAGVVVLKPLSLALAAGDPIYCVIRGSAVNNDGFSNGLTAPNPQAQEAVLREAYERAGVTPSKVHYVEAHGTGTILGDPVEAKALGAVLGRDRPQDQPLIVGSVKTNIGHLEAAAGVAGLIKVALAIKHRAIPPSLHFKQPNPYIPFEDLRLTVQQSLGAWPHEDEPAVAGVSSFGFGGTNCHVVLEEWRTSPVLLLPLSAESPESLKLLAREFQAQMAAPESRKSLSELCTLAALRLSQCDHRLALTVRSDEELATHLNSFLVGAGCLGLSVGHQDSDKARKIVFVFSGQGSQGFGMGRQLLETEPVFRATLERCDQAMRQYVDWSLLAEITANKAQSRLAQIDVMWPVLFAIEVALAALWRSWGIEPDVVVGHSLGEVAAAYVAGVLSLEDAVRVVYHQSRLVKRISGQGAMALVELSWEQAQQALVGYEDRLCLAISSSPTSTVLSGDPAALAEVLDTLKLQDIFCRFVKTDAAVHSPQIDPLEAELASALSGLQPRRASVPIVSTLTAKVQDGYQFDVSYWVRNLREPVLFSDAIAQLLDSGHDIFLELSPHPILGRSIEQSLTHHKRQGTVLASLRLEEDEREVMLDALGVLYTRGLPVHWHKLYPKPLFLDMGFSPPPPPPPPDLFLLSAHTPDALRDLAQATLLLLADRRDIALHDLCYTASLRRSHHDYRLAVVIHSQQELAEHLEAFVQGAVRPGMTIGRMTSTLQLVFVFSDQDPQWWGMGRELLKQEPVFRATLEQCDKLLRQYVNWSVLSELTVDESRSPKAKTAIAQPAIFALQVALVSLWRSWGIVPDAVVGYGAGEIAAAHVAGVFSLEDAVRIVYHRSRLMQQATEQGKMASELVQALQKLAPQPASLPIFSTVTGQLSNDGDFDAAYWGRNITEPIHAAAVDGLVEDGYNVFLEISPHPVFAKAISQCLSHQGQESTVLPSLRRHQEERAVMLESLGALYTLGYSVDWRRLYSNGGQYVRLPSYPWQRDRYWLEAAETASRSVGTNRAESVITARETSGSDEELIKYYASSEIEQKGDYLRFGAFHEIVPGFSWVLTWAEPEKHKEDFELVLNSIEEVRSVIFKEVNFSSITKFLDIGCGYSTDLVALAKEHSHLELHGYNIYTEQIEIGNKNIQESGLQNRIKLYQRDSSKDDFPEQYDLVTAFEVVDYANKPGVVSNVGRHLKNGGIWVLTEICSNLDSPIDHSESSAYFIPREQCCELLAQNNLRVLECVDMSQEVSNFLYDPKVEENFSQLSLRHNKVTLDHLRSSHMLGELLQKQLTIYVLLTVQKDNYLSQDTILRINREKLGVPVPYSKIFGRTDAVPHLSFALPHKTDVPPQAGLPGEKGSLTRDSLKACEPESRPQLLEFYLCKQVARVLEILASELDVRQPLNKLGLDSLMALEVRHQIEADLGVDIPVVKLLEGISITQLVTQVLDQLMAVAATPSAPLGATQETVLLRFGDKMNAADSGNGIEDAVNDGMEEYAL